MSGCSTVLLGDEMVCGVEWAAETHQRERRRQSLPGRRLVSSSSLHLSHFLYLYSLHHLYV